MEHAPETFIRISEISTNDFNNLSKIPLTVHGGRTEMSAPSSKSHSKYFSSHPCLEASLRGVSPTRVSFVSITFLNFLVMSFWYRNQSKALLLLSRSSSHRVDFLPKLTPDKIANYYPQYKSNVLPAKRQCRMVPCLSSAQFVFSFSFRSFRTLRFPLFAARRTGARPPFDPPLGSTLDISCLNSGLMRPSLTRHSTVV